jgi:peptidoglycan/LPS O-acetylase OafA/YrhL
LNGAVLDPERNETSVNQDLLRIATAQILIVGHQALFASCFKIRSAELFPYIQNIGAIIFFVLFGFAIAHSLVPGLSGPSYGLTDFAIDRASRICSAYLCVLSATALIDGTLRCFIDFQCEAFPGWNNFLGSVLMLQNYLDPFEGFPSYGSSRHLWSVAVEFYIYLFAISLTFAVVRRNWWRSCLFAVVAAPVPLAFFFGESHGLPGTGLFTLWLLGFAIYYFFRAGVGTRIPKVAAFAAVLVFDTI